MSTRRKPAFTPQILKALEFAALAHKDQMRKFPAGVPYFSHPAAVGMILLLNGYDENTVIAGILHDVIEDTAFTAKDIKQRFGAKVLSLVQAVTEDKNLPWQDRKEDYNKRLAKAESRARAVSAADLLANSLSSLAALRQGLNPWKKFSKDPGEYVKRSFIFSRQRFKEISKDKSLPFLGQLEQALADVEKLTRKISN